ncbi:hypothetical protein CPB85DRAFT_161459 [Mucidula mucida]|nr:hypothetical protein CPB85DRAFT_161459 [Mucidula mucida]
MVLNVTDLLRKRIRRDTNGLYGIQNGRCFPTQHTGDFDRYRFWCGGTALCDVLIAVFVTHYLAKHDSDFRHASDIKIDTHNEPLTALGALLDLILLLVFPFQSGYMSVALWLPKLYATAMIMAINARLEIVSSTSYEDDVHMMSFRLREGAGRCWSPCRDRCEGCQHVHRYPGDEKAGRLRLVAV